MSRSRASRYARGIHLPDIVSIISRQASDLSIPAPFVSAHLAHDRKADTVLPVREAGNLTPRPRLLRPELIARECHNCELRFPEIRTQRLQLAVVDVRVPALASYVNYYHRLYNGESRAGVFEGSFR